MTSETSPSARAEPRESAVASVIDALAEDDGVDLLDAVRADDGVVRRKVAASRATLPFYTEGTLTRSATEVTVSPVVEPRR